MKKAIFCLAVAAFFIIIHNPADAQSGPESMEHTEFSADYPHPWEVDSDSGLTYRFMGDHEKGGLQFFMRKENQEQFTRDPATEELNAIEPAVGVQFKTEF